MIYAQKSRVAASQKNKAASIKYLKKELLHFDRATQLEANLKNNFNLARRYSQEINNKNIAANFCVKYAVKHYRKLLSITGWDIKNGLCVDENRNQRKNIYFEFENLYRNILKDIPAADAIKKESIDDKI